MGMGKLKFTCRCIIEPDKLYQSHSDPNFGFLTSLHVAGRYIIFTLVMNHNKHSTSKKHGAKTN